MTTMTHTPDTWFAEIAGRKIQLTRAGSGPPLLYLHGALGESDWFSFVDRLAEKHTVYLPAHPGFATSEGLETIDNMQDLAWHYVDFLGSLGLSRVPIVGFSLGGWMAMQLAILRPELVGPLTLVCPAGIRIAEHPFAELFVDDFDHMRQLLFGDPKDPIVDQTIPTHMFDSRILPWLRAREATAKLAWNPYLHDPKLPAHLHRIRSRTQIIWGEGDRLLPVGLGERIARMIPGTKLTILPNTGHMVPFEQPERLAAEVEQFLAAGS